MRSMGSPLVAALYMGSWSAPLNQLPIARLPLETALEQAVVEAQGDR